MGVAIVYHEEFGLNGEQNLRGRIIPSFNALKKVIHTENIPVFTPQITANVIEIAQKLHTEEHIEEVKKTKYFSNALLSAASVMLGAELVAQGKFSSAFAYTGCAGHHASRSGFWGYCYLNDAAIAIHQLRTLGYKRFLILDVDPHFGDGTRDFFQHDANVIHLNLCHEMCSHFDLKNQNYDYAISNGTDEEFLAALEQSLNPRFDFEFMLVIFGHDSHYLDYGGFSLWDPTFSILASMIRTYARNRPLLWVLSGGSDVGVAKSVIPEVIRVLAKS